MEVSTPADENDVTMKDTSPDTSAQWKNFSTAPELTQAEASLWMGISVSAVVIVILVGNGLVIAAFALDR